MSDPFVSVRQLGADDVIDYRSTRFDEVLRDVDVVLDTIGGETQERSLGVLKRSGALVSTVHPIAQDKAAAHGVRGIFLIQMVLPLSEGRKAQELRENHNTRGKIVLSTV
jgi:NADPH:quinone reductase-like Zn-dependent oxidoreductase